MPEADHDDPGASLLRQAACTPCSTVPHHTSTLAFQRTGIVQHGAMFSAVHSPRAGKYCYRIRRRSQHVATGTGYEKLAHRAGSSHKTVHDREQMAQRFAHHLLAQNIQVTSTSQLKARHIAGYIHERLAQGISLRTLQNENNRKKALNVCP